MECVQHTECGEGRILSRHPGGVRLRSEARVSVTPCECVGVSEECAGCVGVGKLVRSNIQRGVVGSSIHRGCGRVGNGRSCQEIADFAHCKSHCWRYQHFFRPTCYKRTGDSTEQTRKAKTLDLFKSGSRRCRSK